MDPWIDYSISYIVIAVIGNDRCIRAVIAFDYQVLWLYNERPQPQNSLSLLSHYQGQNLNPVTHYHTITDPYQIPHPKPRTMSKGRVTKEDLKALGLGMRHQHLLCSRDHPLI